MDIVDKIPVVSEMQHNSIFKDGAWHGVIDSGGQFPPERIPLVPIQCPTTFDSANLSRIGLFCPLLNEQTSFATKRFYADRRHLNRKAKGWPGWKFLTIEDSYEGSTEDRLFGGQ